MNVSKALLSEVLGEDFEILSIGKHFVKIRHLEAYIGVEWCIHKVAHECKEWAFWNDYRILIKMTIPDIYRSEHKINYTFEIYHTDGTLRDVHSWFDTELEAIFTACQWVLDNKDKQ